MSGERELGIFPKEVLMAMSEYLAEVSRNMGEISGMLTSLCEREIVTEDGDVVTMMREWMDATGKIGDDDARPDD